MRTLTTPTVSLPFAFVAFTILAGCADAPTAALHPAEFQAARAPSAVVARPWKGRCDVETTPTEFGSSGPTKFYQIGLCQLAHLGLTTVVTYETFLPESGAYQVSSTFTAANGDELHTTGIVRAGSALTPDGSLTVAGTYMAVGGTGRFAVASGTAVFAETARIVPERGIAVGSYTLEGRLAY